MANNRLTKTDFIIVYSIIGMLVLFIAGFFLGSSVVKKQYAAELKAVQENLQKQLEWEKNKDKIYSESELLSFYQKIYVPFERFRETYLVYAEQTSGDTGATERLLNPEIKKLAESVRTQLESETTSFLSPSLNEAKAYYLRSIELFLSGYNQLSDPEETNENNKLQFLQNRLSAADLNLLQGQVYFYRALANWEYMHVQNHPQESTFEVRGDVSLEDWNTYTFHEKNLAVATLLLEQNQIIEHRPEDITVHINSLVTSGRSNDLGVTSVSKAIQLLEVTDAVKQGDFQAYVSEQDPNIPLPALPLFAGE